MMYIIDFEKQIKSTERILITTDYQDAQAIYKATRQPVIYIPNDKMLEKAITHIHKRHPKAEISLAANDETDAKAMNLLIEMAIKNHAENIKSSNDPIVPLKLNLFTPPDIDQNTTKFTDLKPKFVKFQKTQKSQKLVR